jgi:hypothetical protein
MADHLSARVLPMGGAGRDHLPARVRLPMKEGEPSVKPAHVRLLSGIVIVVTGLAMGVSRPIALRAQVQASERRPSFEVASVKQNLSNDPRSFGARPGVTS